MKASGPGEREACIPVLAAALPLFLLGRRGGPMASVPSVKWGQIIGPVGTRLCEATSKAPGCGTQCPLSPELVPVFPGAKAPGPADTSGRVWATGGGRAGGREHLRGAGAGCRGGHCRAAAAAGTGRQAALASGETVPLARRWLAPGSALSLRQARSLPRRQKEASARRCQEEVNSESHER